MILMVFVLVDIHIWNVNERECWECIVNGIEPQSIIVQRYGNQISNEATFIPLDNVCSTKGVIFFKYKATKEKKTPWLGPHDIWPMTQRLVSEWDQEYA